MLEHETQTLSSGLFRTKQVSHSQDPAAGLNIAASELVAVFEGLIGAASETAVVSEVSASRDFWAFSNAALKLNACNNNNKRLKHLLGGKSKYSEISY